MKAFKGHCGYCGEFGHKAAECPNKKSNQNKGQKATNEYQKNQSTKGDSKGNGHGDTSKFKCYNCGEYGHFTQDCPKAHDKANIAQESEQNNKVENMLDLDGTHVHTSPWHSSLLVLYPPEFAQFLGVPHIHF